MLGEVDANFVIEYFSEYLKLGYSGIFHTAPFGGAGINLESSKITATLPSPRIVRPLAPRTDFSSRLNGLNTTRCCVTRSSTRKATGRLLNRHTRRAAVSLCFCF